MGGFGIGPAITVTIGPVTGTVGAVVGLTISVALGMGIGSIGAMKAALR